MNIIRTIVIVVQLLSHVWLFAIAWTAACQATLSFTISPALLKLLSIESVMASNHLICQSLIFLSSIFSSIRMSALCIRWPKYWSFSTSPSSEYSGLISFRIDWFDLLAVQETLKNLLQHHNLKESLFWHSAFFMVHSHICTWLLEKNIALTIHIFVSKVIPLLVNTWSRFVRLPLWLSW